MANTYTSIVIIVTAALLSLRAYISSMFVSSEPGLLICDDLIASEFRAFNKMKMNGACAYVPTNYVAYFHRFSRVYTSVTGVRYK